MSPLFAWSLALGRPEWLAVLLLAPLFGWLTWRVSRGRPRAADWTALGFRAFLLLCVALALSAPRVELTASYRCVAYVLDVSESIPPSTLERMQQFIARSGPMRGDDDDVALVVVADGAAVETPFSRVSSDRRVDTVPLDPLHVASVVGRGESDLEDGLRLTRAGFPPGGARRIVLITDGNQTRGDALTAVRALLADGVDVQAVPVRYTRDHEVHVRKLVTPGTAPSGQRIPVRAVVSSSHPGVPARIRFLVDGREVAANDETLERGDNVFEMGYAFDAGAMHGVEVVVEPAIDGNSANNRGLAVTHVRGDPRVLVISDAPGSPLAEALREGLEGRVDVAGTEGMPATPGELVPYDGIVLENVAAFALSDAQRKYLAYGVREMGLGFVCVGGRQVYGPGGYAGTEIEEVLPVSSEVRQKRVMPSGALVIVLHTCEFANGNEIARQVTKLAIRALSSHDEIGVIEWGLTGDEWVIPLKRVGDKARRLAEVDAANPSDMPSFGPSMTMAQEALEGSTASVKHMMIISDGDATPPSDKLVQRIKDDGITITTVAVCPHGGVETMERLAAETGGNYYLIQENPSQRLPQIFIKEAVTVRRSAWKEEAFTLKLRGVHDMLRQFGEADFPTLQGYTVTSLKDHAEMLLSGPEEDPVLATWRHGLGEVTAWTSDASSPWAESWVRWPGYGRFWSQVVRSTMRALERPGMQLSTDVEAGTAHVVLDALEPDGSYMNGLSLEASALAPDGGSRRFAMTQTGPGRYEGSFPASGVGIHVVTLNGREADAPPDAPPVQVVAGAAVAYSAEHLAQGSDERFFAQLEADGVTLLDLDALEAEFAADPTLPDPAVLPWTGPSESGREPVELWPWLAALAALLLVADVAVRRVRFSFAWVRAWREKRAAAKPRSKPVISAPPAAAGPARRGAFDPTAGAAPPPASPQVPKSEGPAAVEPPAGARPPGLLGAKRRAKRKQQWEDND